MIIYKVTNNNNGRVYIGQTYREMSIRWNEHKSCAKNSDNLLSRAIRKHGIEAFSISTIFKADSYEQLNKMEDVFICQFNSISEGYNVKRGGDNAPMSLETKGKISKANKGKKNKAVSESNRKRAGEKRESGSRLGNTHARKAIVCIENNQIYSSITVAAKELNVSTRMIQDILRGKFKQVKGYSFKYT